VILVGERRAEDCHDPVAHDDPLVLMDRLHHLLGPSSSTAAVTAKPAKPPAATS
jgi:hypothetical protein